MFLINIFATQFHPEKSGSEGIKIYKNFINLIEKNNLYIYIDRPFANQQMEMVSKNLKIQNLI